MDHCPALADQETQTSPPVILANTNGNSSSSNSNGNSPSAALLLALQPTTASTHNPSTCSTCSTSNSTTSSIWSRRPKSSSAHHLSIVSTPSCESDIEDPLSAESALKAAATTTTTTADSDSASVLPLYHQLQASTATLWKKTSNTTVIANTSTNISHIPSSSSSTSPLTIKHSPANHLESDSTDIAPQYSRMLHQPQVSEDTSALGGKQDVAANTTINNDNNNTAAASVLASLRSPCFYHKRFDDAVDIERVLNEIKSDASMSHSRLVQTATSVREVSRQLQRQPVRRAVRNVMIVTKARDNRLVRLTRELAAWLLRTPRYGRPYGVNVYVDAKLRRSRRFDAAGLVAENPDRFSDMLRYWTPDLCWSRPETFDLVLTLGGDGTVLYTSWLFQRIVPPVLSFALGSLGFLTTFDFEHYRRHLDRVMGDDGMKINMRMRFTCTVWRHDRDDKNKDTNGNSDVEQFEVLNELVIDRGPSPYVSNLELYGDGELLTVVQADGCIFSTPTGSTAYSLSAGGALVHPDIPAILLTPICPHTLSFRPMVLADTTALRVAVPRASRATAHCAFDGKGRIELRQGDYVAIAASPYPFPTVVRADTEWFDSVSRTLRWNTRAATQKPFINAVGGDDDKADNDEDGDDEGDEWDIDTDSACYASEDGSASASPSHRQMSMLRL